MSRMIESSFQRMLPLMTAVAAGMATAMLMALVIFEKDRTSALADRDIVEASQVLHSASIRFEELLELKKVTDELNKENARLRDQVEFLREKNDFLEQQLKEAELIQEKPNKAG